MDKNEFKNLKKNAWVLLVHSWAIEMHKNQACVMTIFDTDVSKKLMTQRLRALAQIRVFRSNSGNFLYFSVVTCPRLVAIHKNTKLNYSNDHKISTSEDNPKMKKERIVIKSNR